MSTEEKYNHLKFFTQQEEGKTFGDFATVKDSLDMIICSVLNDKLKERMLHELDLNLDKAIKLGHAAEDSRKHVMTLMKTIIVIVYKIDKKHTILLIICAKNIP